MKEKNIVDRVPTYPGRIKLTPVSGQADVFTMERADEPTVEGTPLDKATLDSIIQSRLTGRFYEPTVTQEIVAGLTGLTTSPIPTSGWVYDTDNRLIARSGQFVVEADSDQNTSANRVDDVFNNSGWQSGDGLGSRITVYCSQALKVEKMQFSVEMEKASQLETLSIFGSQNGESWQALGTYSSVTTDTLMEYTLINTGDYNYYRIEFVSAESNRITVKNLSYSLYNVSSYTNAYLLDKMPVTWDKGQRLTIYTPTTVNTYAVAESALNGVKINTILQNGKRYELRYNGSTFDAKEV